MSNNVIEQKALCAIFAALLLCAGLLAAASEADAQESYWIVPSHLMVYNGTGIPANHGTYYYFYNNSATNSNITVNVTFSATSVTLPFIGEVGIDSINFISMDLYNVSNELTEWFVNGTGGLVDNGGGSWTGVISQDISPYSLNCTEQVAQPIFIYANCSNSTYGSFTLPVIGTDPAVAVLNVNPKDMGMGLDNPLTTDWSTIEDFSEVYDLTFQHSTGGWLDGVLSFPGPVNLLDQDFIENLGRVGENLQMAAEHMSISEASDAMAALNQTADLTFYVNYDLADMYVIPYPGADPILVYSQSTGEFDEEYLGGAPTVEAYNGTVNMFNITVNHWSEYYTEEHHPVNNIDTGEGFGTIQEAIDAANTTDGDTITVDPGAYSENIIVSKSLTIMSFSGMPWDTIVSAADPYDHVFFVDASRVNISGFTITGADMADEVLPSGIFANGSSYCNFSNNNITGNYEGIHLYAAVHNEIYGGNISGNGDCGIYVESTGVHSWNNVTDVKADGNEFGIYLYYEDNCTISGCTMENNTASGIFIDNGGYNTIADNTVLYSNQLYTSSDQGGIVLYYSDNNTLEENIIQHNANAGIYFYMSDYNALASNEVHFNCGGNAGVLMYTSSGNEFTDNNVSSGTGDGLEMYDSNNNTFSGNNINDNMYYGVYMSNCDYNTFTDNTMSSNNYSGIIMWGSSHNDVSGGTVDSNGFMGGSAWYRSGIVISNAVSYNNVTGVNITNNDYYGIYVWSEDNCTISGCTITGNGIGVCLDYSVDCTISSSNISENNLEGILLSNSDRNSVDGNTIRDNLGATTGIYMTYSDENELIDNEICNNGEYGIYVEYSNYNDILGGNISEQSYGIYVTQNAPGSYNNITGATIFNNSWGICLDYEDNCTISECTVEGNYNYGIYLGNCVNITLAGNTIQDQSGSAYGVYVWYSNYCQFMENTVDSNNNGGIHLYYSNNNELDGNTMTDNYGSVCSCGIYTYDSDWNTISNNNMSENRDYGIYLDSYSENNTIVNNTINDNEYDGIVLRGYSNNNTINNNTISGNGLVLRYIYLGGGQSLSDYGYGIVVAYSSDNEIFNNYFENDRNAYQTNSTNAWNTTQTIGTNIIGGPYLGGNYWSDYEDLYVPYATISDGFWDTEYAVGPGYDYYPLAYDINYAPVIFGTDDKTAKAGEEYYVDYDEYDSNANDTVAGGNLTWALETNANGSGWLWFDTSTGVLNGTPSEEDIGTYWVNISLTDDDGAFDYRAFNLYVYAQPVHRYNLTGDAYYDTISQAAENATPGDTIEAVPITFYENVNINIENITLCGMSETDMPTIDGRSGDVIYVSSDNVNFTAKWLYLTNGSNGIYAYPSYNLYATILGCTISNCSGEGIYLYGYDGEVDGLISENSIFNCGDCGIYAYASDNQISIDIMGNTIYDSGYGIYLDSSSDHGINSNISDNTIYGNAYDGLYVTGGSTDGESDIVLAIIGNEIRDNDGYGIYVYPRCDGIYIYDNTIINNSYGAYFDISYETDLVMAQSGSHAWYSGAGAYTNKIITREFDLRSVSEAALAFWEWYATESGCDYCYIEIDDGSGWTSIDYYDDYSYGWQYKEYDISEYAGSIVQIRFRYETDSCCGYRGWYVDDIAIEAIDFLDDAEGASQWTASPWGWAIVELFDNAMIGNSICGNTDYGAYVTQSDYAIASNNISNNGIYGIYLYNTINDTVYNNYFDNPDGTNAYDDGSNIWNISKTIGTNIIGGPYLGGNYWSDYSGADGDGDGIGDESYEIAGGIYDELPLAALSPGVVSKSPASGATGVSVSANVIVTFNTEMNTASVQSAFSISPSISGAFSWSGSNKILTFNPIGYLAYSTTYTVTIASTAADTFGNEMNSSAIWSFTTASAYTPPTSTVPSKITDLSATAGNAYVLLSWTAPSNGGSAITGYKIYRGTTSGGETLLATVNTTSYNSTGLTNGATYYYKASAVNAIGEGLKSDEVNAIPMAVPSKVAGLTATAGNAQVSLAWAVPSNGGSAITGYNIYRGTAGGGESLLATVTSTSYVNTGITNGVTYYYKVSAVNAIGEGLKSDAASATPQVPAEDGVASEETMNGINDELGLGLEDPFYAEDSNGDGDYDSFTDPNGVLEEVGIIEEEGGNWFLISADGDAAPEFMWNPETDEFEFIAEAQPTSTSTATTDTEVIITVTVAKDGWIYVYLTDEHPDLVLLKIQTSDGRTIPGDRIWREDGKIYFLDDPATAYQIIYQNEAEGSGAFPLWATILIIVAVAAGIGVGAFFLFGKKKSSKGQQ